METARGTGESRRVGLTEEDILTLTTQVMLLKGKPNEVYDFVKNKESLPEQEIERQASTALIDYRKAVEKVGETMDSIHSIDIEIKPARDNAAKWLILVERRVNKSLQDWLRKR